MSDLGKILHYIVILGLFFALPLAVTIFSYRKVLKNLRGHNTGTARNLRTNNNETVTTKEIRLSKSLFVVVFAFMLCLLPAWVITILTRLVPRQPLHLWFQRSREHLIADLVSTTRLWKRRWKASSSKQSRMKRPDEKMPVTDAIISLV